MDFDRAWQFAELRWWSSALSAFVAAHTDDEERAREAKRLAELVFASGLEGLEAVEEIVGTLADWAYDLVDHPHYPARPRPDEADRQVRDHLKDVQRDHLPVEFRDWMSGTQLSVDVDFDALHHALASNPHTQRRLLPLRAGHDGPRGSNREAAERELKRLRELRNRCDQGPPSCP